MARRTRLYQTLFGLSRNPFPDHAIASAGGHAQPFYEDLYPGIRTKMARAFVGENPTKPTVAFLWSLGEGEEARGYGKTRHLMWFADYVNQDQGRSVLRLAGGDAEPSGLMATYAAFSTVDGLSLSNLLFDVVRDIVGNRRHIVVALRDAAIQQGHTAWQLYESAERLIATAEESWSPALLNKLCHASPEIWVSYINDQFEFRHWHRVRYGRLLFRSVAAFLRVLGVSRLLVLVDQVEDFASWATPSYKLNRDFHRFAHLCTTDKLLKRHVTFVLTMHPRAARILSWYWRTDALGPVRADGTGDNIVRIEKMNPQRFVEMAKRYLESARMTNGGDGVHPFTVEALRCVCELEQGRPGHCLQALHRLLEAAVEERLPRIDRDVAVRLLGRLQPETPED